MHRSVSMINGQFTASFFSFFIDLFIFLFSFLVYFFFFLRRFYFLLIIFSFLYLFVLVLLGNIPVMTSSRKAFIMYYLNRETTIVQTANTCIRAFDIKYIHAHLQQSQILHARYTYINKCFLIKWKKLTIREHIQIYVINKIYANILNCYIYIYIYIYMQI